MTAKVKSQKSVRNWEKLRKKDDKNHMELL